VPYSVGQRSKFIDKMMDFFEKVEEYEKCQELLKLKKMIIDIGD